MHRKINLKQPQPRKYLTLHCCIFIDNETSSAAPTSPSEAAATQQKNLQPQDYNYNIQCIYIIHGEEIGKVTGEMILAFVSQKV